MTKTHVLYNDACPICAREIKHYDRLAKKDDLPLAFEGLQQHAAAWGIAPDDAAKKLHVRRGDEVLTGFDAFVAIWGDIPRYRGLAKIARLPVIRTLVAWVYDYVAAPLLYGLHKRRQRKFGH